MTEVILYTTEDGRSHIKLRAHEQTVWLTQLEVAELFDVTKQNISLHLKNVFKDGELDTDSVVKDSLTTQLRLSREATVKQSLTVQIDTDLVATTEKSSVVQLLAEATKQRRPCFG
jgi:hypothetical protein